MRTLQGLGWNWRQNGVVLSVLVDGQKLDVFVPLNRVWHEFHSELAAVGCPLAPAIDDYITVSGLFSSIAHAVKGAAHAVTHNAVTRAATNVSRTATNYAEHAVSSTIGRVPVLGSLANAGTNLMLLPTKALTQIASGGRLDQVALNNLKSAVSSAKDIAPYAQTVLTLVPGVGQGLSGAIGASLALAQGQTITEAMLAGVKGALPGGPIAQAAFSVASDVAQGKPVSQVALNALPIAPAQKLALARGLAAAKDLAAGKNVSQIVIDQAMQSLPPNVHKAIQIGTALAHAKSLQQAAHVVGSIAAPPSAQAVAAAAQLATRYKAGVAAANAIKSLPRNVAVPPHLTATVKAGLEAHATVNRALHQANAGHPAARQIVGALTGAAPATRARVFVPRYHSTAAVGSPFFARRMHAPVRGIHSHLHH